MQHEPSGERTLAILVTGGHGFIGMQASLRLLARGERFVAIDNLTDYLSPRLKNDRIAAIEAAGGDYRFIRCDFLDYALLNEALADQAFTRIVQLGAQAGVRYPID